MKKKSFLAAVGILCVLVTALCACTKTQTAAVSMYDLKSAMAGATTRFEEMSYASSEDADAEALFANVSDMNYGKVAGFFIYYATNGTGNADELAVIQVKNATDITEARKALEAHLAKRKSLYATYDKSQLKKLDAARVEVEGSCAALIAGDEADKISDAFHAYLNGD